MKTFYCTSEDMRSVLSRMSTLDQNTTHEAAERWLQICKRKYSEDHPEYWDKVKIFRVTVEEVPR